MTVPKVLTDIEETASEWSLLWNKTTTEEWVKLRTPLGPVLEWGLVPFTQPLQGIDWRDFDYEPNYSGWTIEKKDYETQKFMLEGLSKAVADDILLNKDNMILLVDLAEGKNVSMIFPSETGETFFGIQLNKLIIYADSDKSVETTREFYNSIKRGVRKDYTGDYETKYSYWTGWLDGAGDFYGNIPNMIRDFVTHQFDDEHRLNLHDYVPDEFRYVWVVVAKPNLLPIMLNWNIEAAQELWNLLSR